MFIELLVACIFVTFDMSIQSNNEYGYFITYVCLFVFIKIMQYIFQHKILNRLPWNVSLEIILVPIGSMFLAYCIFYTQYELGIYGFYWRTIISILILLCINIMMFNIFVRLSENMELQRKTAIYEKEFNLLEHYVHEREKLMQDFRIKRHDLKHQMLNLSFLLKEQKYHELEENIEKMAGLETLDNLFLINTENSIIDTFINNKYAVAKEKGIAFNVNLNIPIELPIAGEDLCVILGNALDNSIEACLRGNVVEPQINLNMVYDGENLVIVIGNTFDGIVNKSRKGEWLTRKEDIQHHGIGIHSIQNTIRKYNGYYNVVIENKMYILKIILHSVENE